MLCPSLLYSKVTQLYTEYILFFNILFHYGLSFFISSYIISLNQILTSLSTMFYIILSYTALNIDPG